MNHLACINGQTSTAECMQHVHTFMAAFCTNDRKQSLLCKSDCWGFFSSFFSSLLWSSLQCTLSDLDKGYLHRACLWHLKGPCVLTATLYNQQIYYFLQSKALHIICKSPEAIKTDLHSTWIVSSVWNCKGYLGWKCLFMHLFVRVSMLSPCLRNFL